MTRPCAVSALLLSPLLLAAACSGGADWAGRIEVEEGITHVYNPDTPLRSDHGPLFVEGERFGGAEVPEEQLMTAPVAVEVTDDGTRLLLDAQEARILRYAADGSFLGSFGRKGEGPGEFQSPSDMTLLPDGTLAVADNQTLRLSFFSAEGDFISSRQLDAGIGQLAALSSGDLLVSDQPRMLGAAIRLGANPDEEPALFEVIDRQGEERLRFGAVTEYEGLMLGMWMNRTYATVTSSDSIVVNYLAQDRIELYASDGRLARVIHRSLPWEPIEPVEESNVSEEGYISMRFDFDILSTGMAVSPDGSLWAVAVAVTPPDRSEAEPGSGADEEREEVEQVWAIDLFDATGRWLARHSLGTDVEMPFLDWWADGLYLNNPYGDASVRRFEYTGGY